MANMHNTALITGASSGIGLELAKLHAEKGGDLVLVARSADKLEQLAEQLRNEHKVQVTVLPADLSEQNAAEHIFNQTQQLGIEVDTLINNAGFGGHGKFAERALHADQAMMQVNMNALVELTHYFTQGMIRRKQGKILNVSSTASFIPGPLQAVYYATKAFVTSFSQAIAQELAEHNITVTALCPGPVATEFASAGNLDGVEVFNNARSARSVAECGYNAMHRGDLLAFNEAGLKFLLNWVIPFLPRKLVLKLSRQSMEKTA
ncbi:SDR family NAD(P)-dependent oxidoreductase [Pseudoalteromonas phenolica]|uniref:Short-chain dehydrogenase n=1 Tax=Pseudoalteromonas phenolica TaxID=161398 RepID=A0A0S2JZ55_9GAMM|nr:SDR family oxidoreductase [Pseudoalteromonas phenolica]ALO41297.1 Short-chain dehydrogenase [Pseudoalteromonas phenolica]MBE0354163.1 hypothetical protein [Pseudoalteromonas phenolica O-BC30]